MKESNMLDFAAKRIALSAAAGAVLGFQGPHRFLSNFWFVRVMLDGQAYPSVEHAYQAAKTTLAPEREAIRALATPGAAKRAGRQVTMRSDWTAARGQIMLDLVRQKFARPDLARQLLATGAAPIFELNQHGDRIWGVVADGDALVGANALGQALEIVRVEIGGKPARRIAPAPDLFAPRASKARAAHDVEI